MADVSLSPAAEDEYNEALEWYEGQSARSAAGFEAAVAAALDRIRGGPEQFATVDDGDHRLAPVGRYPYGVIYRVVGGVARVVAIAHSRRRPGYWSGRT